MRWLSQVKRRLVPGALRGRRAEQLACEYLTARGFEICERNVRYPVGEIDVVAREGNTQCFIEVRSTASQQWGGPLASITDRKRRRLVAAARWYLHYAPVPVGETRFDVVAIEWREGQSPKVELVRAAFSADR